MPSATATAAAGGAGVAVLLPLPLAGAYTYRLPPAVAAAPGDFVAVPFGSRQAVGVVWDGAAAPIEERRLKAVTARLEAPPVPESLRRFVEWVADYTLTPVGAVLRMCMSVPDALSPAPPRVGYVLAGPPPEKLTPARRRVLELAGEGPPRGAADLAEAAGVGPGVVRGLVAAGTLAAVALPPLAPFAAPDAARPGPALAPAQDDAARALAEAVAARRFSVTLLEGVTGAGKTEVYFEAIAAALRAGRQVLVLVPEIALTHQWLDRFAARFGAAPAEWHSDLRPAQRRHAWRAVAEGSARVVVGARSALFLPFRDLGLVVVDEEHDASFKQEEGVIYNARDMAVVRGRIAGFPVVLVSATPSLETVVNCERGRYRRLHLPERHAAASLPRIEAIDLRRFPPPPRRFLAPPLLAALRETFAAGEQAMLFLNRRGYAPLTLCGACGHRLQCPNCSAWLVEHRFMGRLMCHHCGHTAPAPEACPSCGAAGRWRACGPGVERLAEEVAADFPDLRSAVMASDTLSGPRAAAELLARIAGHEIDLVIGTQIVAKGHHFPMLTLVGVVDADLGLEGGDLRAAERTHQLLTQVAGRAGRAERPGRVLLQTFRPDHPVMRALVANDAEGFRAAEAASRRAAGMPPFGRLAALIVSGPDGARAAEMAAELGHRAPRGEGIAVFGPAPAPLALLRGRHRHRLLLKTARNVDIQALLRAWTGPVRLPADVRLAVDVDPYSFL
jgi:primosomal protein N' (replication factor Y)